MKQNDNILKSAENYLNEFECEKSVEELFIEFQTILNYYNEFQKEYFKSKEYYKIGKMQRDNRKLSKKKLFTKWLLDKNIGSLEEIAEITFMSDRNVRNYVKSI